MQRIMAKFARHAFRRSVTDADIEPFVEIVADRLASGYSFEQAIRVGLKGILVSPDFLLAQ